MHAPSGSASRPAVRSPTEVTPDRGAGGLGRGRRRGSDPHPAPAGRRRSSWCRACTGIRRRRRRRALGARRRAERAAFAAAARSRRSWWSARVRARLQVGWYMSLLVVKVCCDVDPIDVTGEDEHAPARHRELTSAMSHVEHGDAVRHPPDRLPSDGTRLCARARGVVGRPGTEVPGSPTQLVLTHVLLSARATKRATLRVALVTPHPGECLESSGRRDGGHGGRQQARHRIDSGLRTAPRTGTAARTPGGHARGVGEGRLHGGSETSGHVPRCQDNCHRERAVRCQTRPSAGRSARASRPAMIGRPPTAPSTGSIACSGCGINPSTFPSRLQTAATSPSEPFGLSS
jgi:hypothetical protein